MKIDEACINHNVVRLINDFEMWDLTSDSGLDENMRIMALGYIKGLTELAEALKEVLWRVLDTDENPLRRKRRRMMIDEIEHTCQFCYYEYFDSRAYPCSMCVCGEERKDMFQPKGRQNKRKESE